MDASSGAGRVLAGRYRLLDELGRGGMGVVWRARDEVLGREVAVKEVRAPAGLPGHDVHRLYARLEREGRAAARVSHRNVVTVHDVTGDEGRPWIVMELVRGMSLADLLQAEGPLDPARAAHIGAEVLAALRGAHAVGVLHRDVKPGNVLIGNDGRVVLSDFGIAMIEGSSALTATGQLVGSPEYLAPERALGHPPGPESDLWSLGVTLYAAVEGMSPFRQDTPLSTLRAVVDAELPPATRAGALSPVLEGLLRKDPARRLGAAEAERMLRTAAAGGAPRATPGGYVPTVAAPQGAAHRDEGPAPFTPPRGNAAAAPGPGTPGPGTPAAGTPAPDRRRKRAAIAVGALVAALAVGAAVWALTGGGGTDGGDSAAAGGSAGSGGKDAGAASKEGSGTAGASSSGSAAAGVSVTISALRERYSGPCPPPERSAPAFKATVTVDRVPADVVYRWVTGSGGVTGGGWKSFRLGEGTRSRVLNHTEAGHRASDPDQDWVALEVKSPRQLTSRRIAFTVSCTGSGTNGGSAPGSSAPSGSSASSGPPASSGYPAPGPSAGSPTGPGAYGGGTYGSGR
ncbi:serine/threonine-protein kinase [Streptomyces sp. NPDC026206]|uniref:serine/threonine-protein kinase n=1 Tax=Streptomyces sp. NPDC026206 TaxID=3157089 RepID=UPI003409B893